jgi:hypothetical protein
MHLGYRYKILMSQDQQRKKSGQVASKISRDQSPNSDAAQNRRSLGSAPPTPNQSAISSPAVPPPQPQGQCSSSTSSIASLPPRPFSLGSPPRMTSRNGNMMLPRSTTQQLPSPTQFMLTNQSVPVHRQTPSPRLGPPPQKVLQPQQVFQQQYIQQHHVMILQAQEHGTRPGGLIGQGPPETLPNRPNYPVPSNAPHSFYTNGLTNGYQHLAAPCPAPPPSNTRDHGPLLPKSPNTILLVELVGYNCPSGSYSHQISCLSHINARPTPKIGRRS